MPRPPPAWILVRVPVCLCPRIIACWGFRTATMPDDTSLRRQWILLKALSARRQGLTVREMASDLGVNVKTVRRDLDLFRGLGFPLEDAVGEFGRKTWRIKGGGNQPPLSFSFDEAVALHLGRRLLE